MTIQEAIEILRKHNEWRRGVEDIQPYAPSVIGEAIDVVVEYYYVNKTTKQQGSKHMTIQEAVEILRTHNEWRRRRGVEGIQPFSPTMIGEAIDVVVEAVEHHISEVVYLRKENSEMQRYIESMNK